MIRLIGKHIKAVIFDFDDTLVETIDAKWASHKYIASKHYGKILTDDDIRPHWGKPLRTLVGILYGDQDLDRALAYERSTHRQFPKPIFDDTLKVLRAFKQSGMQLGLVTATTRDNLITDLEVTNIPEDLFGYTQTQDDTKFHKPDPRVFDPVKAWLDTLRIKPKETVYVGDGLYDLEAALAAGFEFIGVATGLVTQEEFHSRRVRSVRQLSDLLDL